MELQTGMGLWNLNVNIFTYVDGETTKSYIKELLCLPLLGVPLPEPIHPAVDHGAVFVGTPGVDLAYRQDFPPEQSHPYSL